MSSGEAIRTAVAALRGGRPVRIEGESALTVVALETATAELLGELDPRGEAPLLISGRRAAALGLANERDAANPSEPVLIAREPWLDPAAALAFVDPSRDFARGPVGPLRSVPLLAPDLARAALRLARNAGLLPGLWVLAEAAAAARLSLGEVARQETAPEMTIAARARLPIDAMPETQIVAFRASDTGEEHVALVIGAFAGEPPLVRLHSECLTGDVFGSLKCDCGLQLKESLRLIAAAGGGVLLYLRQEGRGIGLANKLRAYALQDRGLDTVEANLRLGFDDDERDYAHAAGMLRSLAIDAVRLLTNNPAKVAGLEGAGIKVVERVPHHMPANPHNADYLTTKRQKSGHLT